MKSVILAIILSMLSGPVLVAGTVRGTIESGKEVKEAQTAVVVWVDGLPPGDMGGTKAVMSQSGVQFLPRVMTVVVGQTVDFPNEDDVAHNVFSLSAAKKFKLGIYPKGESREVTFEKTGVIDLFCSIHRHMHAVIVVTPSEHAVQTTFGETFEIKNVPAGKHTLKIWNAAHELTTQEIEVPEDGTVQIDTVLGSQPSL